MKTVNLQVRINEDLKQEVSSILKAQGLSYTSMLDTLLLYQQHLQTKHQRQVHTTMTAPTSNPEQH